MSDRKNNLKSNKDRHMSVRHLCFASLFAALTCVGTFVSVPLPIGYFNLGDIFVLVGAYALGPIWSAAAAGLGSALADLFMGFAIYAPATFVIKALVAATASAMFALLSGHARTSLRRAAALLTSAVCGEVIMVGGYFLYEGLVLGYGWGAAVSLVGNCMQGVCGVIGSTLICGLIGKYFNKK